MLWVFYLYRRGKAWLFRALALTVLALALSNPLWIQEQREPLKDIVDQCWRLGEVAGAYQDFVETFRPLARAM